MNEQPQRTGQDIHQQLQAGRPRAPTKLGAVAMSSYVLGVAIIIGVALRVFFPEIHASFCVVPS